MQHFRNTADGSLWAFEDDVEASDTPDGYRFHTAAGDLLDVPATLQPYTPPAPEPTLAQQASELLSAGVTITSNSSVVPTAAWPIDPTTQSRMLSLATVLNRLGTFPSGETVWPVRDMAGEVHTLTISQFTAVEAALAGVVAQIDLVLDNLGTVVPDMHVTID